MPESRARGGVPGKARELIHRAGGGVLFLLFNLYVWKLKVAFIYLSGFETEYMPIKFFAALGTVARVH